MKQKNVRGIGYQANEMWQKIQEYLPDKNQLKNEEMPKQEWLDRDNICIHIDHYVQRNPKATVVVLHGVGGNGRLLSFIALPLWRLGCEVICPDLPMYGHTIVKGNVSYNDWVDVAEFISKRYVRENIPFYLFGLSAGGMLAYQTACRLEQIAGVIATCLLDQRSPQVTKETASSKLMAIIGKPFLKLTHKVLGTMKLPMKAVCNMKAIVNHEELAKILMKDSLSSGAKVSLKFLNGLLNPEIEIEAENFDKCPVLLVHPQNDHWTDVSLSQKFFDKLSGEKQFQLLEGAGHFPIEENGLKQLEKYLADFMKLKVSN